MRTFHDQLRSLEATPRNRARVSGPEDSPTFGPLRSKFPGFSPEAERGETPREKERLRNTDSKGSDFFCSSSPNSNSARPQGAWQLLTPYTVLLFSSIVLSQQFGSAAGSGGQILPSLVGATLRSLPELHAAQSGAPASGTSQNAPHPFGDSHEESSRDRKLQNRRLSSVLRLLRRAEKALASMAEDGEERVVLLIRNVLEHLPHLGEAHREILNGPLKRFAELVSLHREVYGDTPELKGVQDALLAVI